MVIFPNCKINLGLYITEKRPDEYHNLETVFYPVAIKDVLEIVPADESTIQLHGKAIEGDPKNNLVWKAWELLHGLYPDKTTPVAIHLLKNIPMGAGMGGGSADGAFMLRLMNEYYQLRLSNEELAAFALQLGSDCPFFIYNSPRYAKGRGELMSPVSIDLSGYSLQIICPSVHISTAAAFKMIQPKPASFDLKKLPELPINEWFEYLSNDFEEPVFAQHPGLKEIKEQLYAQGAIYASMSGSGSTIYGIFEKGKKAIVQSELQMEAHYLE
ncbi:MAG: 4-(cytidine 5'-diphospho)-2-C-methyl-D-erythritol kinase [Bacteroidetes bacterium]|nr:4-(cytidine 5'-diphospho)-2-C-methyl-D-erythritol kinase [Bacteroidota bacterium]